jgi:hypothetical protein
MLHRRLLLTVLLAALSACAFVSGCAGTSSETDIDTAVAEPGAPPEWVRIVPRSANGATCFVGGVSMAADVETGIELATADALSQIANEASRRANDLLTLGTSRSGVVTMPEDRLVIKTEVADAYSERMLAAAVRENEYHRPCGEPGDSGARGPVCQIFVLVSVREEIWDRAMTDALVEVRKSRRMQSAAVELLDWMVRAHGEGALTDDGHTKDAHRKDGGQ